MNKVIDISGITLELGQCYKTDEGDADRVLWIIYLPDDSPDWMATENDAGHRTFQSRTFAKESIALGEWTLQTKQVKGHITGG